MNPDTTLPMDWRPLREAALHAARETRFEVVNSIKRMHTNTYGQALIDSLPSAPIEINAHALLLADLARPASRDFWARWLAAKVGLEVGATAPEWRRFRMALPNGTESWAWALLGTPGEQFIFTNGNASGISTLTDPAAALRAALLAVEPA